MAQRRAFMSAWVSPTGLQGSVVPQGSFGRTAARSDWKGFFCRMASPAKKWYLIYLF